MARRHDARGSPRSARRLSWSKVSRSGRSVDGSGGAFEAAPVLLFLVVPAPAPGALALPVAADCSVRSEEHTSELQSLMRNSYAVFCLKNKQTHKRMR